MNLPATLTVPVHFRAELATYVGIAACFAIGFATATLYRAQSVTVTRTVRVTPTAAIRAMSGAQVVAALGTPLKIQTQNGVTCGVYKGGSLEVCHR